MHNELTLLGEWSLRVLKHNLAQGPFKRPKRIALALAFIALVFIFLAPSLTTATVTPSAEWTKNYGDIRASVVSQTSDGGYVLAGSGSSGLEAVLIKTNALGDEQWQKSYGYNVFGDYNNIVSVSQTADSGFILFGERGTIVKTDSEGNIQWQKSTGFSGVRVGIQTVYGHYVLVGNDADVAWVLKTDNEGNKLWEMNFTGGYTVYAVTTTSNEGNIIAGSYKDKFWCAKLNLNGSPEWGKVYSYGAPDDAGYITDVIGTSDGGFLLTGIGEWQVSGGDVPWLIKIDSLGNEKWHRNFEDMPFKGFVSAVQIEDGSYVAALDSNPELVKVNDSGESLWTSAYEGTWGKPSAFIATADGGFAIACSSGQNSWLLKIASENSMYPITLSMLSPGSKTYSADEVPLTFKISKPALWMGYSLNGQASVTINGNTTLTGLDDGSYKITVYANDTNGNCASKTVYFSVAKTQLSTWLVIPVVLSIVLVALLVYFKKLGFVKQSIIKVMDNKMTRSLFIMGLCVVLGVTQIFLPYYVHASASANNANTPFQVGVSYAYEYDRIGQIYNEVSDIHSLGFEVVRVNLVCDSSDPSHISNSLTDEFIMAAQQFNLSVALILNQRDKVEEVSYYLEHWGNHISYIQILNEPELSPSWAAGALYTDDELFTKFHQFYTVVEPYHSSAKFYTNFEAGILLRPNVPVQLSKQLDFVGYDVFMESFLTLSPRMIQFLQKITNKEVVISEFGMSTSNDAAQADYIIKGLNLFKSMGLSGCWIAYWNSVENDYGIRGRLAEERVGEWIAQNA
jgi:hypothetical protein